MALHLLLLSTLPLLSHPSPQRRADSRTCLAWSRGTTGPPIKRYLLKRGVAAARVFTPRVWVGKLSRRSGSCDPSCPTPAQLCPLLRWAQRNCWHKTSKELDCACAEFDSEAPSRSCVESPTSDRFLWPHWREWRSKVRTVKLARLPVGSKLVWQHALSSCEIAHQVRELDEGSQIRAQASAPRAGVARLRARGQGYDFWGPKPRLRAASSRPEARKPTF